MRPSYMAPCHITGRIVIAEDAPESTPAADYRAERTHLIGPIQETTGSSRRQRISFLKHKVGYKVHKGAI